MPFNGSDSEITNFANIEIRDYRDALLANASTTNVGVNYGTTLNNPLLGMGNDTTNIMYTTDEYVEERNWLVVGVLITLIVMLWIILGGMLCYPLVHLIRRLMPVSKRRMNRRYETIEGWLITKVVRPHDEGCEQIRKKFVIGEEPVTATGTLDVENQSATVIPGTMKHFESYNSADTTTLVDSDLCSDDRECPICMESFAVGDVVSWSSYERCSHVYHHQCIKEWLLRHNNCPFCREIFLPVDQANGKITAKVFRELSDLRSGRAEKTFYCVQDGLVTLETKHDKDGFSKVPTIHRKCSHIKNCFELTEKLRPGITKADLKKLRGDRVEKNCDDIGDSLDVIENPVIENDNNEGPVLLPPTAFGSAGDLELTVARNDSLTSESSDDDEADDGESMENDKVVEDQTCLIEIAPSSTALDCETSVQAQEAQAPIDESSYCEYRGGKSRSIAHVNGSSGIGVSEKQPERRSDEVELEAPAGHQVATAIELEQEEPERNQGPVDEADLDVDALPFSPVVEISTVSALIQAERTRLDAEATDINEVIKQG